MAAGKETSYSKVDENEIDLITIAATDFLFENSRKNVVAFLEKDETFKKQCERSQEIIMKYFVIKVVDATV